MNKRQYDKQLRAQNQLTIIRCDAIERALEKKGLNELDDVTIETLDTIRQEATAGCPLNIQDEDYLQSYEYRYNIKH